jgi:16S rRNA (guanine(527)-N(7))-methyltransferase RsmG
VTSGEFHRRLADRAGVVGLKVPAEIIDKLHVYYLLLRTWNRRMNLTALDLAHLPPEAMDRLLIEPLAAARFARLGVRVVDVGSGGGSPAIPLALACRASELTMVESRIRKSTFLREAAYAVGLPDARVLTNRFENVAERDLLPGRMDLVSIRGVRVADDDWTRFARVLCPGGHVFLLHQRGFALEAGREFERDGPHQLTDSAELSKFQRHPVFHVEQPPG